MQFIYRQALRQEAKNDSIERDEILNTVWSANPSAFFSKVKSLKNSNSSKIHTLKVGNETFEGDDVPDGFFASLSSLKAPDMSYIHSTPQYQSTLAD